MSKSNIMPIDASRDFQPHELFFSTTDRRGVIKAGNEVFARIAAYDLAELVGSPHNVIRHPDMPRSIFRLFWSYLKRGEAVAAYVKNLAKDGRYYWVVALAIPIGDGYLSVRFKPTSPTLEVVKRLYAELVGIEAAAVAEGKNGEQSMDAAAERLQAALRELGHADYDAFMRAALREELKQRDATLAGGRARVVPALPARGGDPAIRAIYEGCLSAYEHLSRLFLRLDSFVALNTKLQDTSTSVLQLTHVFRYISLNTAVKAARLGAEGAGLGVIAGNLGEVSGDVSRVVTGLIERIGETSETLAGVIFNLAGARLQTEMILVFCHELIVGTANEGAQDDSHRRMIDDLRLAFVRTVEQAVASLTTFGHELGSLGSTTEDLRKTMLTLEFIQLGGLVEAHRLDQAATFGIIFTEVRKQLEQTKAELTALSDITETLSGLAIEAPRIATVLGQAEQGMSDQLRMLFSSAKNVAVPQPA